MTEQTHYTGTPAPAISQTTPATGTENQNKTSVSEPDNVADFAEAQKNAGKIRVRLPEPVVYDGKELTELWMRSKPILLDGIMADRKHKDSTAFTLELVCILAGIDLDWLWEQKPVITNKLLAAFNTLLDPVYLPRWEGLTLTLKKPLNIDGKIISTVTLKEPRTKDLMDSRSDEQSYDLIARLLNRTLQEIQDMDYLHDFRELKRKVDSFRDA